ncbi:MAG: response regulator [Desulfobacteraceae bacterium]|nr:response regulator [Desulfobacteraceae bacterium]
MGAAKIMIVEDNTTVAADCHDCLINLGYKVTSIQASGEESIIKAETELPDAVLMDIHLRDKMDGIKAAEHIYNQFQIPVVFLSAYGDLDLLERAKKVGSFGYLIKPFEERELYATLEMALYKAKAEKEHKKMEAQINLLQKMESIGTLAGGIAHDFNNLLYVTLGNITLAEDNLQNGNPAFENLKAAEEACLQAKELTKKLITFSKGGSPVKEKISIDKIEKLVRDTVVSAFKESDIQPLFSISNDIQPIKIDIGQIKQVVNNIAVNAKEAMNNKGVLKIDFENVDITKEDNLPLAPEKYIKLSFKDNGIGIPKQNINKIFNPYFSTKGRGVEKAQGLGLAICHSIITRHNGLITVESEPDAGAVFLIYLPALTTEETDLQKPGKKPVAQVPVQHPGISNGKILVMDDEEAIRTLMHQMINRLGYDVKTCIDGKEAVETYIKAMESKKPFDAVILDLTNKLGMGGQETMEKLLEIDPNTKGIIITGYSDNPVVTNYRAYGFSDFITKPATRDKLSRVIGEVFSRN